MNDKPTPPEGYELMLGKDVPKPVPERTKFWDDYNKYWASSTFVTLEVDEYNQDSWYAVPIPHRDFDIHDKLLADSAGYEPVVREAAAVVTMGSDPKGEIGKTKAPMWLLPSTALIETAWAQQDGATKYGAYNWRETKVCASTYISAMMRHWAAYLDGEDRNCDEQEEALHVVGRMTVSGSS